LQTRRFFLPMAFLLTGVAVSACSSDKEEPQAGREQDVKQRLCADSAWKERNLGLWLNICRQPVPL
jgi:hypothetical protein